MFASHGHRSHPWGTGSTGDRPHHVFRVAHWLVTTMVWGLLVLPAWADATEKGRPDEPDDCISLVGGQILITACSDLHLFRVASDTQQVVVRGLKRDGTRFTEKRFDAKDVRRILFVGGKDDTAFVNETSLPAIAIGGKGHSVFWGAGGGHRFIGGSGHNLLIADGGNNLLVGGNQADGLIAGGGHNYVIGGGGGDVLVGTPESDVLLADPSSDSIRHIGTLGASLSPTNTPDALIAIVNLLEGELPGAPELLGCAWYKYIAVAAMCADCDPITFNTCCCAAWVLVECCRAPPCPQCPFP